MVHDNYLCYVYNLSFLIGVVLDMLKLAKGGSKSQFDNYTPYSVLCFYKKNLKNMYNTLD